MHVHRWKMGDFAGYAEPRRSRGAVVDARSSPWYLVQISDHFDGEDARFLRKMEIELYRPLIRVLKPVRRNTLSKAQRRLGIRPMREKIEPFFPGYAFVNFEKSGERWREIFRMTRIRGLACANNLPLQVSWSLIEQILGKEVDGAIPGSTPIADMAFLIGEDVRIGAGPLASFNAVIDSFPGLPVSADGGMRLDQLDNSSRVKLLVSIFDRKTPVEMTVANIDKI